MAVILTHATHCDRNKILVVLWFYVRLSVRLVFVLIDSHRAVIKRQRLQKQGIHFFFLILQRFVIFLRARRNLIMGSVTVSYNSCAVKIFQNKSYCQSARKREWYFRNNFWNVFRSFQRMRSFNSIRGMHTHCLFRRNVNANDFNHINEFYQLKTYLSQWLSKLFLLFKYTIGFVNISCVNKQTFGVCIYIVLPV